MENIWLWVSERLPHRLVLWCYIRVINNAWAKRGNIVPEQVSYYKEYDEWEKRLGSKE